MKQHHFVSKDMQINHTTKEVFELESESIKNLSSLLTDDFGKAIKIVLDCR